MSLRIAGWTILASANGDDLNIVQGPPAVGEVLAVSSSSAQSAALTNNDPLQIYHYLCRLHNDSTSQTLAIAIGENPTASASSLLALGPGEVLDIGISKGHKVAAIVIAGS